MTSIIGTRFGFWTVIGTTDATNKRAVCRCACGKTRMVAVEMLFAGSSTSCGCLPLSSKEIEKMRAEKAERERQRDLKDWRPGDRS